MLLDELVSYCRNKRSVTDDFPFDDTTLTLRVGGKIFALTDIRGEPLRLNLKCDPGLAEALREEHESILPGYHMNKIHWNTVILDGSLPNEKILWMIDHSYDLVFRSLKRSERYRIRGMDG